MRRLVALAAAGAALWLVPGALGAGWCGTGESPKDLPDLVTGQQIHSVVVVPSDGTSTTGEEWQNAALNYAMTNVAKVASCAEIKSALGS